MGFLILIVVVSVISFLAISFVYSQEIKSAIEMIQEDNGTSDKHIPVGFEYYSMKNASCNNSQNYPDVECFIKSFEKCESASIKQLSYTIEGDPIFSYATVVPEDSCNILFESDNSQDTWGAPDKGLRKIMCTDVYLSDYNLIFQCEDIQHGIRLQLSQNES